MISQAEGVRAWRTVGERVNATGTMVTIAKTPVFPHPRDAGALPTAHWPVGQIADFVLQLERSALPLFVREFVDRYEAFFVGARLTAQALHLIEKSPASVMYMGGTLIGAVIGTAISSKREGALVGAGLGLLVAVLININMQRGTDSRRL